MSFEFANDTPIYLQIIEEIKLRIITGEYLPSEKLPSVREMSVLFNVNPNTVQKALQALEEQELIFTERTNGKFVTESREKIEKIRREKINCVIKDFFDSMAKIGLSQEDAKRAIEGEGIDL